MVCFEAMHASHAAPPDVSVEERNGISVQADHYGQIERLGLGGSKDLVENLGKC